MVDAVSRAIRTCWRHSLLVAGFVTATVVALPGCREDALTRPSPAASGSGAPGGLSPSQAGLVLAKVGDKNITLGEYAATLERMDQFDRLRYQTPERRRELLDHMITVELLAREARRRGLDKDPEMQEAYRQILRDAILTEARKGAREPIAISQAEIRAYYDSHAAEFQDPERRRVGHIVVKDKATAEKLLAEAKKASPQEWGNLVIRHSLDTPGKDYKGPLELAGDLGFVGPANDARGTNPRVSPELRAAVFEIGNPTEVLDRVVADSDGRWHIVKLIARTDARTRPFAEAERMIRITMAQQEVAAREQALEDELRKKYPVTIDESALNEVKLPTAPAQPNSPGGDDRDHGH